MARKINGLIYPEQVIRNDPDQPVVVTIAGGGSPSGGLTDAELRAAPIEVIVTSTPPGASGLTDAELRATPLDLPAGAATEVGLAAISSALATTAGAAGVDAPALPSGASGQIGWLRAIFDGVLGSFRQLVSIAASVKPLRLIVDPATQQVRVQVLNSVTIGTLPTLGTVTTVTTVATLTNQAQLGGASAATLVADSINTRWATTVRSRIT